MQSVLIIEEAQRDADEGMYRCEATNSYGVKNIMFDVVIGSEGECLRV